MSTATDRLRRRLADKTPIEAQRWREQAMCKYSNLDPDFFSNNQGERYRARALCLGRCPVRQQCLQYALDTVQLSGIWGGCDEHELRRTLSVNAEGEYVTRARKPRCPYCLNRALATDVVSARVSCGKCGLTWPYFAEQD